MNSIRMAISASRRFISRHHKYSWALTLSAIIFVCGVYFRQDAINAATFTFAQNNWTSGVTANTATHPTNQTDWKEFSTSTDLVASTTLSLVGTSVSFVDGLATSTDSALAVSGGGFNNGGLSSTATTTSGVSLNSIDTLRPMVASGNQGGEAAFILKSDGTVWQQGNILEYAEWSATDRGSCFNFAAPPSHLITNRDGCVGYGGSGFGAGRATIGKSTGKWYWEVALTSPFYPPGSANGHWSVIGIGNASAQVADSGNTFPGMDANGLGYSCLYGQSVTNGSNLAYGAACSDGNIIGVALDADAGTVEFFKNNVSQGVLTLGFSGPYYPMLAHYFWSSYATTNFGPSGLAYTPPVGFAAGLFGYVTQPTQVAGISGVVSIAHGTDSVVALKSDGTVWEWTKTFGSTPTQVSGLSDIVQISSGGSFSLALKNDGTVWAWGHNNLGQRGDGGVASQFDAPAKVHGVGDVGFLGNIVLIGAANSTGYAVDSAGVVYAWGGNYSGQVGNGNTTHQFVPLQISVTDVVQIIGGTYDGATYALKNDGTVWGWGANTFGELGTGNNTPSLTPIQITTLSGITQISAGHTSGYALKTDGTVLAWGYNAQGQLGDTTTTNNNTPTPIPGLTDVVYVAGDFLHAHALKSDGTLWSWGQNDYGQLGNGNFSNSSTPTQSGTGISFNTGTYAYTSTGDFTSGVLDFGHPIEFNTFEYATTLNGQTITMDVCAGDNPTPGTWTTCINGITSGGDISTLSGFRYAQYHAHLSTSNTSLTPVLNSVTFNFTTYTPSGSLISSVYDTGDVTNHISVLSWNESATTTSQTIKFQVRSSPDGSTWSNWCGYADTGATCTGSNYFTSTDNGVDILATNPLKSGDDDRYIQYQTFLGSGGGEAPYLLDDDGTVAGAYGYGAMPATGPGYQTVSYTTLGNVGNGSGIAVANSVTPPDLIMPGTGKVGFGMTISTFPDVSGAGFYLNLVNFNGATPTRLFKTGILRSAPGVFDAEFLSGNIPAGTLDFSPPGSITNPKFGVLVDWDTNTVRYYYNGTYVGDASSQLIPGQGLLPILSANDGGAPAGELYEASFVTSATDLAAYGFPAGTTDLAGNLIGGASTPILSSISLGYDFNVPPQFDTTFNTTGITATQETGGEVTITYKVRDIDTLLASTTVAGYITPSFEYSTNGGSTWTPIPSGDLTPSSTTNKAVDPITYATTTATWNASTTSALFNTTQAKIRITADDNETVHSTSTATTATFSLITVPTTPTATTTSGGGGVVLVVPPINVLPTPTASTTPGDQVTSTTTTNTNSDEQVITDNIPTASSTLPSDNQVTETINTTPESSPQPTFGETLLGINTPSGVPTLTTWLGENTVKGITAFTTLPGIKQTLDVSRKVIEDPLGNIITKTVATAGVAGGTALAVTSLFLNPLTIAEIFLLPARIFAALLSALGIKKRSRRWGTVYDSVTKQPLDPAYVVLKDADGKEVATSITDLDGRYGFLIGPGTYTIEVNKTNYTFPSTKLANQSKDILYDDLYFGESFTLLESSPLITKNIPLDPTTFDWNEFTKQDKSLTTFVAAKETRFQTIATYALYLGLPVAIIGVIIAPAPYNAIIMGAYIILGALRFLGFKPKAHGTLKDNQGNPLSYAIVRVHDMNQGGKEIFHRVADAAGRYYCLVQKGTYTITVEQKNPDETYTLVYTSPSITTEKGVIQKDINL